MTIQSINDIHRMIYLIRGRKVMLDRDLAALYGVPVKRLNEQVRRNRKRFPSDFKFQLSREEAGFLRSQIATLEPGRGKYSKYVPDAFTEHGAVMLASVLSSPRAIQMSVDVVRAFIEMRRIISATQGLEEKMAAHEKSIIGLTNDCEICSNFSSRCWRRRPKHRALSASASSVPALIY